MGRRVGKRCWRLHTDKEGDRDRHQGRPDGEEEKEKGRKERHVQPSTTLPLALTRTIAHLFLVRYSPTGLGHVQLLPRFMPACIHAGGYSHPFPLSLFLYLIGLTRMEESVRQSVNEGAGLGVQSTCASYHVFPHLA